jgi:dTMP kinase
MNNIIITKEGYNMEIAGIKEGFLLAVEGLDGSGKNCQTNKMKEYLESKGIVTHLISFPQYETVIGKEIAKYLQGEFGDKDQVPYALICIAYAADRTSIQNEVFTALARGEYVIMDRYTYSNLFTAAKMPEEKWTPFIEWIEDMEFNNLQIAPPDYNFYLYVDPQISIKRIAERGMRDYQEGKKDIHENDSELLINTAKCYLDFAMNKPNWFIIDQMNGEQQLNQEEVFEKIKEKLDLII